MDFDLRRAREKLEKEQKDRKEKARLKMERERKAKQEALRLHEAIEAAQRSCRIDAMEAQLKTQSVISLEKLELQEKEDTSSESATAAAGSISRSVQPSVLTEEMTESLPSYDEVEKIIGYTFQNKALLMQALTHSSFRSSDDSSSYERLEYVGDSVLNFLMAKEHFFRYPEKLPGELTRLRAANVDNEKLARAALNCNLYRFLRHRKPMLEGQIEEFMAGVAEYPLHSNGLIDAPKVLADIVESTIGAIFIDSNSSMETTWEVVKHLVQPLITPETLQLHPVTKLHELCQKNGMKIKVINTWATSGQVEIYIDNEVAGRGVYKPKKLIAINRATHDAYNYLIEKLASIVSTDDGVSLEHTAILNTS